MHKRLWVCLALYIVTLKERMKYDNFLFNVTRWFVITYLIHPVKSFVPFFFHGSS